MDRVEEIRKIAKSIGVDLKGCDNQTDLFEEGIMDSLQIAMMVGELEKKYQFKFELDEINPDVFETFDSLAEFIDSKLI